jgi:hypothetical protein
MGYLSKLIHRAVDNRDLENNKIGKYRISPQHGINVSVFHVYKKERHIATIDIARPLVEITTYGAKGSDIVEIHATIKELYHDFEVRLDIQD